MKFLHKGECYYTEKVFFGTLLSTQLNVPVLSMFSCVALQNAGLAIFIFLGNRIFSEKIAPQNIFTTRYFIATVCVYRQNKTKMDNFCMH